MTTPLGIRTVWKSLIVVAGIALLAGVWLALTPRHVCGGVVYGPVPQPAESELTRNDILVGMRPMTALVQACHDRFHVTALVNVEVEISPEGTVTKAIVHNPFIGPTGACVEAAVRHALFRPSKTATNIDFPFFLRPRPVDTLDCGLVDDCGHPPPVVEGQLTKFEIVGAMQAIKWRVQTCYDRFHVPGLANVSVVISQGRVTTARVSGSFAETPTGACVEAAVEEATFRPSPVAMNINYPFMLR